MKATINEFCNFANRIAKRDHWFIGGFLSHVLRRVEGKASEESKANFAQAEGAMTEKGSEGREPMRYEVGYNKPIRGNWGLQYEQTLETDDLDTAKAEIRNQVRLGHTRGLILYDRQEKIVCVREEAELP